MSHIEQLVVVSCYTRFDNLAHGPKGTEAKMCLYTFRLNADNGQMTLVSVSKEPVMNPAFSRFHPRKNVLYTCTESVAENGQIDSWSLCPHTGQMTRLSSFDAGGTSTCYITLDRELRNMLVVNYWDATIGVFALKPSTGEVAKLCSMVDPNEGREMKAKHDKHVNHSENDEAAQKDRQSDPHSHAVILDPFFGRIAYVPDLGMDLIRQFLYDGDKGTLTPIGHMPSGPEGRVALGPRYIEFHPFLPVCYVINELSSEISVFEFDRGVAEKLLEEGPAAAAPTLRLVQTVRTIPTAFPGDLNTCGRLAVHPGGNFVMVSNRGHNSIAVMRVHHAIGPDMGCLSTASIQHTRGSTPRHFQFDRSGQWILAANQDSDSIAVFNFNPATGKLKWTGHEYRVPSPNFVCVVAPSAQVPESLDGQAVPGAQARL